MARCSLGKGRLLHHRQPGAAAVSTSLCRWGLPAFLPAFERPVKASVHPELLFPCPVFCSKVCELFSQEAEEMQ